MNKPMINPMFKCFVHYFFNAKFILISLSKFFLPSEAISVVQPLIHVWHLCKLI